MLPSPSAPIDDTVDEVIEVSRFLPESLQFLVVIAVGLTIAAILAFVISGLTHRIFQRTGLGEINVKGARIPIFGTFASIILKTSILAFQREAAGYKFWQFALLICLVFFLTWLIIVLVKIVEEVVLARIRSRFGPGRRLAKVQTQVGLLRRVLIAVLCIIAVAAVLLTIEQVRALGAGILASAGLASVVVGLAVQSSLANVFAGLQIAFTDSVRVDDIVVVEAERGTVEEITLTYVVVLLIDGRRMILPSTYFTTTPFENWSRRSTEIDGNITLQLKLNAPIEYLRTRTTELLESSDWWDGRTNSLLVTDTYGGLQTVTIYLSSRDPGDLWNLRNMLREKLLSELVQGYPECLPDPRPMQNPNM
ncbi:mechanosensitive ion channel protein MscS [Arthrobacter sp. MYb211]|uniref:mechanosensitive ion channel family protein n=1 Tax=unclassified Arthrobacter TaxID=235627 RepID=UPI000CFC85AE|nr:MULTISPECIES: mechanosensitive ion channel family protein [unclassified Arthrobacter]PRA08287.1 mechanosensitive ion channel protein MscS [Arthrobacter sp. MYb221]PRC02970.1 mechanosensitive ion channel protein MscS [Arthrobacter sp. MYb211]